MTRPFFRCCLGWALDVYVSGPLTFPVNAFKDGFTMKHSAAKTLGVAALGAAFAAAGAGAANAAPAAPPVPDVPKTLETVTQSLPTETVTQSLPGAGEVVTQAPSALGGGHTNPVGGLIGGLPVHGSPAQGGGVNGLPLGGVGV